MSSSGISAKRPGRRAASCPRKHPCICRKLPISIRKTADPPALASNGWKTADWCGSQRNPEKSSMSDAGDKPAKAPKAKAPKQAAAEKEAKPGKQQAAAAKEGKAAPKKKADGAKAAPPPAEVAHDPNYVPRFKSHYLEVVRPELMKKFGYKNKLQAPRIEKIVLNI